MELDMAKFNEKLRELLELGKKKKNILEYQEVSDFFQDMPLDAEQMEKVFDYLENSGIDVLRMVEPEKEPDVLLLSDEDEMRKKKWIWKTWIFRFQRESASKIRCGCI